MEKTPKRYSYMTQDLWQILNTYPALQDYTVESFTLFYYPVAIMEMALNERSIEDFEAVQLPVLRMVGLGFSSPRVIAETLCLTEDYVNRVLQLLAGYGLLNSQGGLTELGQKSCNARRRITMIQTTQAFQMDPLSGKLLTLENVLSEHILVEPAQLNPHTPILRCGEGVAAELLTQQILGDRADAYIHHNPGVFHVNVEQILDARCLGITYAKSYLMKLTQRPAPLCFALRYDETRETPRDRLCFRPYGCESEDICAAMNFDYQTPIYAAHTYEFLQPFTAALDQERRDNPITEEDAVQTLAVYGLEPSGLKLGGPMPQAYLDASCIRQVNSDLFAFLRQLGKAGNVMLADQAHHGWLLRVYTEDVTVKALAKQLCSHRELDKRLLAEFKDYAGSEPLTKALLQYIKEAREDDQ